MKVLAWYRNPSGIENKNIIKYTYPIGIKLCEVLIIDTRMVSKKEDTSSTLVLTNIDTKNKYLSKYNQSVLNQIVLR